MIKEYGKREQSPATKIRLIGSERVNPRETSPQHRSEARRTPLRNGKHIGSRPALPTAAKIVKDLNQKIGVRLFQKSEITGNQDQFPPKLFASGHEPGYSSLPSSLGQNLIGSKFDQLINLKGSHKNNSPIHKVPLRNANFHGAEKDYVKKIREIMSKNSKLTQEVEGGMFEEPKMTKTAWEKVNENDIKQITRKKLP